MNNVLGYTVLGGLLFTIICALLLFFNLANARQDEASMTKEQKEIRAAQDEIARLFKEHDAQGLAHMYTVDASMASNKFPIVKGRAEILKLWQTFLATDPAELHITYDLVYTAGNLGVETGNYSFWGHDGKMIQAGYYVQVYRRQPDGKWQSRHELYTA